MSLNISPITYDHQAALYFMFLLSKCVIVKRKCRDGDCKSGTKSQNFTQNLHQTIFHFKTKTKQKHVALLLYNI